MMQMNFIGWASYLAPIVMQNPERQELTEELEKTFAQETLILHDNLRK